LRRVDWGNVTIDVINPTGPFSLMEWDGEAGYLQTALEIIARYSIPGPEERKVELNVRKGEKEEVKIYSGTPNFGKIDGMLIR
jgi:hypothetical protein